MIDSPALTLPHILGKGVSGVLQNLISQFIEINDRRTDIRLDQGRRTCDDLSLAGRSTPASLLQPSC